ncbi:S-adenosyl-L-methionine-dependent methyltransferase [Gloeopeniophorella convolvens]|nr:S-adenosyl-L-methionine-dependent methyltransferase [Gloeopeniophorella convolvens]
MSFSAIIVFSILLACGAAYLFRRTGDPYGTFHIELNKVPGGPDPPQTEWLNMGYWKDTAIFPEACQALALRLFRAAALKPQGRVLDVGHGSGESLVLQLTHLDVPRPAVLCGITSLPSHYRRSRERVGGILSPAAGTTAVRLFEGDAVWRVGQRDHPLAPGFDHTFDSILALDCAYHFETRQVFLRQSFSRLEHGGRVALADICFSHAPNRALTFLLSRVLRVLRRENIVTIEEYEQRLRDIGYEDVEIEDITPFVLPGFRNFLKQRGNLWKAFTWSLGWLQGHGMRFVIARGTKPPLR